MSRAFDVIWEEYQHIVASVAGRHGAMNRRWGADMDDFTQEIGLWIFKNADRLYKRHMEDGPERFTKYLARCLDNECRDYSIDIRDQSGGQPREGAYFYGVNELKLLLDAMFDEDAWLNPPQYGGDVKTPRDPATGGNWITTLADVSRAYAKLSKEDRDLLAMFHRDDWRNKDLASAWNLSEAQMSSRHTRAVEKLLDQLGGPKPDPMRSDVPGDPFRGRRSISNAKARAMTNANYEEN